MTTALAPASDQTALDFRVVTPEQRDLVKRTIAVGATDDELALFIYDNQRRGVHPLDRLIHFTVRQDDSGKRKYTPITSVDYLRARAHQTGVCAGISDPVYDADRTRLNEFSAHVTVKRIVKGVVAEFSASARWMEYYPGDGPKGFMWRQKPYLMLGKCAEALALRKAFPQEMAGISTLEEDESDSADDLEFQRHNPEGAVAEAVGVSGLVVSGSATGTVVRAADADKVPEPGPEPEPPGMSPHQSLELALRRRYQPLHLNAKLLNDKAAMVYQLATPGGGASSIKKLTDISPADATRLVAWLKVTPVVAPTQDDDAPAVQVPGPSEGATWNELLAVAEQFKKATKEDLLLPGTKNAAKLYVVHQVILSAIGSTSALLVGEAGEPSVDPVKLEQIISEAAKYARHVAGPR